MPVSSVATIWARASSRPAWPRKARRSS